MKYGLVTGGSRGIGRAIALSISRMGYRVIINYHSNTEAAEETLRLIRAEGGDGELLPFDVSNEEDVDQALLQWEKDHPDDQIEVLVNNAGIRKDNLMIFMQNEDWHSIINTHLNGFFYTTRRLLKGMLTKRYGRIINVVSLSGIKGLPGQTNYSAAKAGIIGASKALAQEVAPRKITVNCVAPGFIHTDMTAELPESELKTLIPMGRFGNPEEVAAVVAFLASKNASYITGEVISVNGGLYT
ncbi:MAG TPA: 3-oxoacyl-ACP reductase FabG [Bacteroidales bacterium]|nr:3-oxoacyl-ACP reductase FabG [Bacteroidales bacterium]HOH22191.1 3-oxoacyl-ACP reductase FabG [Bacteroidales bacterium]HPZ02616.1 3-oxoacyl-ACP reductase FabG [Bacteroidales bacterium]HQB74485.1 3-oxoacyl-ACP reductase FabG [Bacteroidales bacterium]